MMAVVVENLHAAGLTGAGEPPLDPGKPRKS